MTEKFRPGKEFANKMDQNDPLKKYREHFYIPEDTIYLDGNSLGLLSKEAEQSVISILEEWKNLGIKGWLDGKNPWFYLGEKLGGKAAKLVGAKEDEIILTGSTTVNIHQLISTFYEPRGTKTKIIADELNFPSDIYALESQIKLKGLNPEKHLVLASGEEGKLNEEEIVNLMDEDTALVFLPSVLYTSGQQLDMEYLTKKAHEKNILIGFDCAHSVGVIPHKFDKWGVDFATWCGYKYLNGGPGCTAFIYVNKKHFDKEPGLAGWWGYKKDEQFDMKTEFKSAKNAGGLQISTPNILGSAALKGSLELINDAGIDSIREKSLKLTNYLMYLIDEELSEEPYLFSYGNPKEEKQRGGHVALKREEEAFRINEALKSKGIVPDFRPPNVIRIAPIPLYNTYSEVWKVVQKLKEIIDQDEYQEFSKQRDAVS